MFGTEVAAGVLKEKPANFDLTHDTYLADVFMQSINKFNLL